MVGWFQQQIFTNYFFLLILFIITSILSTIAVNRCCVCDPTDVVLWRLVQVLGQTITVAATDTAAVALVARAAVMVRIQPVDGERQEVALVVRVVVVATAYQSKN